MSKNNKTLRTAAGMAVAALPLAAGAAEWEISGVLKNETAAFIESGQVTGQAKDMLDSEGHDAGEPMKFENSVNLFINGDFDNGTKLHSQLQAYYDSEAPEEFRGQVPYTQSEVLRELYLDFDVGSTLWRVGKQQVVWGTADGIKLLDIINPTDFREFSQNTMEDSRIPLWMVNTETPVGATGNLQFIVSQAEENKIPGLDPEGAAGHPFLMKGVDTMTGKVNGFYNIAPALGNVAASFNAAASGGMFTGNLTPGGLTGFGGLTVDGFASMPNVTAFQCPPTGCNGTQTPASFGPGYVVLNNIAQSGLFAGDPNGNNSATNLLSVTGPSPADVTWSPSNAKSAFEYMSNATFATFNTFSRFDGTKPTGFTGIKTRWLQDYPDDAEANAGFRFRNSMDNGLNWTLNYFYHYSANPDVNLSWVDPNSGEELQVQRAPTVNPAPGMFVPDASQNLTRDQARSNFSLGSPTSILVRNGAGAYYGAYDPSALGTNTPAAGAPDLLFTESLHRVHSLGTSFDYSLDAGSVPVVLRGEFLYDQDDVQPVIDKYLLGIGDLTGALTTRQADYFKYVLGVDITVLTNLMLSTQFIQFRNLDYVDRPDTCTTQGGNAVDCGIYTGDMATLHLSNGLQKGEENKEFVSLFLSKPFGEAQRGRWNNLLLLEDTGGRWDRLDLEYSFTDALQGLFEVNYYFGDEDSMFGQFKKSSNVQIGAKYFF